MFWRRRFAHSHKAARKTPGNFPSSWVPSKRLLGRKLSIRLIIAVALLSGMGAAHPALLDIWWWWRRLEADDRCRKVCSLPLNLRRNKQVEGVYKLSLALCRWCRVSRVLHQSQVVELHVVDRLEKPGRALSLSSPESLISLVTPAGPSGQKLTRLLITVTLVKQVPCDENSPFGRWTDGALCDKGVQGYGRAINLCDLGQYKQKEKTSWKKHFWP